MLVATKKKLPILKKLNNGIKKSVFIDNEGNYLIKKEVIATGEITTTTLSSDLFDINEVVKFFSDY